MHIYNIFMYNVIPHGVYVYMSKIIISRAILTILFLVRSRYSIKNRYSYELINILDNSSSPFFLLKCESRQYYKTKLKYE